MNGKSYKTVLALCAVGLVMLLVVAWNPSSSSFNVNQFGVNNPYINLKSGLLLTNTVLRGSVTDPNGQVGTAGQVATSTGSTWGWSNSPAGGSGSVTNGALVGDVTKPDNSGTTTLATVNGNVGSFGDATHVGAFTVNGKGLLTAASSVAITGTFPLTADANASGFAITNIGYLGGSTTDSNTIRAVYGTTPTFEARTNGDLRISGSYYGLVSSGAETNAAGSRVSYLSDIANSTNETTLRVYQTNIDQTILTPATATNTLPLYGGFWRLVVSGPGAITNLTGVTAGVYTYASYVLSNSLATSITNWLTIPAIAKGYDATNSAAALGINGYVVGAGKEVELLLTCEGINHTNWSLIRE